MYTMTFMPSNQLAFHTVMSDLSRFHSFLMQPELKSVCIDLSGVTQCDSAGLALLIEAKRLCQLRGLRMIVQHMPGQVEALAEFCGVHSLWSEV